MTIDELAVQIQAMESRFHERMQHTEDLLNARLDSAVALLLDEIGRRSAEATARLDRMESSLSIQSEHVAGAIRIIGGFTQWANRADADYRAMRAELAEITARVAKLEHPPA